MSWLQPRSAYTDHGELLEKENLLTGTKLTLTYDERGQLIRAILPGGQTIQYSIDGEGKRLAKTVDGVLSSVYLHDVQGRLVAELDPSGVFKSRFIYATQAHSPDYMIRDGVNYFFAKDQLGSVRAVADSNSGNVLQLIQYDEFGRVLADTNPGFQPFGFAGGHYDHQTGLVRFGARDYDPEVGRWLSKDPILFDGGDTNLYGYVLNDPVNLIDPEGLYALCDGVRCSFDGSRPVGGSIGGIAPIGGACDIAYQSRQKGERNQTAKPDGTSNPFKHMKPDPNNPNRVERRNPHTGKKDHPTMPDGFKEWWNRRHPNNQIK